MILHERTNRKEKSTDTKSKSAIITAEDGSSHYTDVTVGSSTSLPIACILYTGKDHFIPRQISFYTQAKSILYPGKYHSTPRQRAFYTQANIILHPGKDHSIPRQISICTQANIILISAPRQRPFYTQANTILHPGKDHSIPRQISFYTQAKTIPYQANIILHPGKDHTTVTYWRGSTSFKYLHILVFSKPMYSTVATHDVLDPSDLLYLLHKPVQQDQ